MKKTLLIFFIIASFKSFASYILIPMDAESQKNHLKAYGITYWTLEQQLKVKWLLNCRGGSFLLPDSERIQRECQIRGVSSWSRVVIHKSQPCLGMTTGQSIIHT